MYTTQVPLPAGTYCAACTFTLGLSGQVECRTVMDLQVW